MPAVVTISATFGAGGSRVGPALAHRLGVPFLDRAIPVAVASRMSVSLQAALAHDEHAPGVVARVLAGMARMADPYLGAGPLPASDVGETEAYRQQTEEVLRAAARSTGAVILGRAAAIVLADEPGALHARLDGPRAARAAQAARAEHLDPAAAWDLLVQSDRTREAYVRYFYSVNSADPRYYHVLLDGTALPIGTCVEVLALALAARRAAASSD